MGDESLSEVMLEEEIGRVIGLFWVHKLRSRLENNDVRCFGMVSISLFKNRPDLVQASALCSSNDTRI